MEPARRTSSPGTPAHSQQSKVSIKPHDDFVTVSSAPSSVDATNSQHSDQAAPSSSGHFSNGPQAASQSTGQLPTSAASGDPKSEPQAEQANAIGTAQADSSTVNAQPDAFDPCQQSLNALQEEKQHLADQTDSSLNSKAALDSHKQSGQKQLSSDIKQKQEATSSAASEALEPSTSGKSSLNAPSAASPAAAGVTNGAEAGSEGVNASPVGSASTDAWEMVQDANNIYNWKAGSMFGRSLSSSRRQGSECSEEGESYSQCEQILCVLSVSKSCKAWYAHVAE